VTANLLATIDKGFFKEEGLDVEMIVAANPADALKLVSAGSANFGMAHSTDVILARSRDMPIVSLGTTHQFGMAGIMAPTSLNIKSPKDVEGKSLGITGIPANRAMLEHVLRANGVDTSKVQILSLGFGLAPMLIANKVDVLGDAISWNEPIHYNKAMSKPLNDQGTHTFLAFYQFGLPRYYTHTVISSEDYLKANPAVAKKFMKAWIKGLEWTIANPDGAIEVLTKRYPELEKETQGGMLTSAKTIMISDDTKKNGSGWMDPKVWEAQAKFMLESKLIDSPVDTGKAMTTEYLPK
jgi:putative hydroxymethylpyrimidine transport system substrate-binding protein